MLLPPRRLLGGVVFIAPRLARCAAALLLGAAVWAPARAAGLQVTPISLDIRAQEQGQSMVLSNSGNTVLRAQVRVQQWTQVDGVDQLESTREVVASPPLVEIAPGQRQMVRIVRLLPAPAAVEKTYRLIIDELPGAQADAASPAAGLQFLLRYSVPVFVLPPAPLVASAAGGAQAAPASAALSDVSALAASVQPAAPGASMLSITNQGPRRAKLSRLVWVDAAGLRTVLIPGLVGYVLAGQTMVWPLALPAQGLRAGGVLKAKFNDDQDEQTLALGTDRP